METQTLPRLQTADVRKRVQRQLAKDYAADLLGWLDEAEWDGPVVVPLDDIDYDRADEWRAAQQTKKLARFVKKVARGQLKPVILVTNGGRYAVIDGHHRALAYRILGDPVLAYVGQVEAEHGPWETMHDAQRTAPRDDA